MKKYNIIFLLSIIALLLNSCFSLDQEPYDNARAGNTFNNAKEVRNWLNGIYNTIRDNIQGETMYLTDLQADYLNLTIQSRNQRFSTLWRTQLIKFKYCKNLEYVL